jgi:hypothetical protein
LVCEVVCAFVGTDSGECFGDCRDESFDGSGGSLSQQGFEFGKELFDGIPVLDSLSKGQRELGFYGQFWGQELGEEGDYLIIALCEPN